MRDLKEYLRRRALILEEFICSEISLSNPNTFLAMIIHACRNMTTYEYPFDPDVLDKADVYMNIITHHLHKEGVCSPESLSRLTASLNDLLKEHSVNIDPIATLDDLRRLVATYPPMTGSTSQASLPLSEEETPRPRTRRGAKKEDMQN